MHRLLICLATAIALSGCAASRPAERAATSLDQLAQQTSDSATDRIVTGSISQSRAFVAMPPEAGAVKRIAQKWSGNGLQQTIVLGSPVPGLGENEIDLRVRTSDSVTLEEPQALAKPTEAGVLSELAAQFPKMPMHIVDRPRSNAYGPYGLAVGRWANGARCIYAWQWIDNLKPDAPQEGRQPATLRIRLCQVGVTLDQMAGYIDRLELHAVEPALAETTEPPTVTPAIRERPPARGVAAKPVPLAKPATAKPARQVVAAIPETRALPQADQLDQSLPAAAYRGPSTLAPTAR